MMHLRTKNPAAGRSGRVRPRLETLEDRNVPSVVLQGHTLLLSGDSSGDMVTIRDGGHGNVTATMVDAHGHRSVRSAVGVQSIVLNSNGGADHVDYALTAALTTSETITLNLGNRNDLVNLNFLKGVSAPHLAVHVNDGLGQDKVSAEFGAIHNTVVDYQTHFGNGQDAANVSLNGAVTGAAKVGLALTGGSGLDVLNVQMHGNIAATAQVAVNARGGVGDDSIHVDYWGKLDGRLSIQEQGVGGWNWLESSVHLAPGSTGWLTDHLLGGLSSDLMILQAFTSGSHLHSQDLLANGGAGYNQAMVTRNVRVVSAHT
jgi:hypothetical protein